MKSGIRSTLCYILVLLALASCSSTKYVPAGSYLLDDVRIRTDNDEVRPSDLALYVRQNPNAKWFSLLKTQLYVYNWSGRDTTRWINRVLRRLGDPPVIYNEQDARRTADEMAKAVRNMGYMSATVTPHAEVKKKKLRLTYHVHTGLPYVVRTLRHDVPDEQVRACLRQDSASTLLHEGMYLDANVLDAERLRIVSLLLRQGYYKFNKDYIHYTADTLRNSREVDLTLHLDLYRRHEGDSLRAHPQYRLGNVSFITDYNVLETSMERSIQVNDSLHYRGYPIYFKDRLYLRPRVLTDNLYLVPGQLYDEEDVQRTYTRFGRLQALKYANIRFFEPARNDSCLLNAYVMLTRNKPQSISFEVDGTNSAGDLGAGASVSYTHRNLFRGSESFLFKLRGAYEASFSFKRLYPSHLCQHRVWLAI